MNTQNHKKKEKWTNGTTSKLKFLCFSRHYQESEKTMYRMKKIANHISDMGFILKMDKEFLYFNNEKQINPLKTGQRFEYTVLQRRHTNGQQAHEKMVDVTSCKGNAGQTTVRYQGTPARMAKIKGTTKTSPYEYVKIRILTRC